MKIKNITTVFLVVFSLVSCTPAKNSTPTEISIPDSTVTPIRVTPTVTTPPLTATFTPTPAPENIADAKDLPSWVSGYINAFGGKVTINGIEMNASQLVSEIKNNPETHIQTAKVNGKGFSILVVNKTPLAMMGSDNIWRDIVYKDFPSRHMTIGSSVAIWTGDFDNDPRYQEVFVNNFEIGATDGTLSDYELMSKISSDTKLTPQQVITYYDWTNIDKLAKFLASSKIPLRAMHLIDGYTTDSAPSWLSQMSNSELEQYIKLHIQAILTRHQYSEASVVNEAFYGAGMPPNNFWYSRFGDRYIELAFTAVKEISPETKLFLNENIVYGPAGMGSDDGSKTNSVINGESTALFNYVKKIKSKGIAIDGVGIESHIAAVDFMGKNIDLNIENYKKDLITLIKKFQDIGIDVYITELDVNIAGLPAEWNNQQKQLIKAQLYRAIFEACLYSENCKSVTTWGFSDMATWMLTPGYPYGIGESPLPLDMNYRTTLANYEIKQVLFENWLQP